ncbi:SigE family RNA polymerase sigma factor [Ornithinimicrobium cryptoxanthini]|uniref:SigE family RNA polymerase sigma factor n=1 Tax=Ornithinimicrobium cryptoxanthini TaxID=2934161 RepID=A0ABY4YEC6_9MICO|nr:SigE family RNA polymerase sigma factor [Ornithinimicrobium cryptoxanthini]USQ74999.1 SigE family RNA polymerase sigma factor [Ornithinimicrobium cryptoxanthini]
MSRNQAEHDFEEFYAAAAPRVVHLVYATTGDMTIAQDSTQEAFARAWQRWTTIREYDEPLAWVRTVARRLAISTWRKQGAQDRAYVRHGATATSEGPGVDRVAVRAALQTLSDPIRESVTLHYIADLSIEQIARETGAAVGTVKSHLHRGRRQLADALEIKENDHA